MEDWEIGARLRRIRELAGLTQLQVAVAIPISEQAYRNYEAGRTRLSYRTVQLLAELFEMRRLTLARALGLVDNDDAETLEQWVVKRGLFSSPSSLVNPETTHRRANGVRKKSRPGTPISGTGEESGGHSRLLRGHRVAAA